MNRNPRRDRIRPGATGRLPAPIVADDEARIPPAGPSRWSDRPFFAALAACVFLAYQPVWQAGFVWDDDAHVTAAPLRSLRGLGRIWWDVGATQQYYPLTETGFWLQYMAWGDWSPGYHLVNISLHALAAILVTVLFRRLGIPAAPLAGALFALHPVCVESVAWVAEQKNTLSAVLYLAAAIAYLRFDESRGTRAYLIALACFILAVLSKIVTVTLPPAVLVALWWRRGVLSWRRDVLPLVPFFAISLGMGLLLAWLERVHVEAKGADFAFTIGQRCLLPARIVLFYLGKLFWPFQLRVIYPRWNLADNSWWPWACWAIVLATLALAWSVRGRVRGPLAALLFFGGTLFPVLGLLDVYWFIFSFVGDHHQYLASLGIFGLVAAGIGLAKMRHPRLGPLVTAACGVTLLGLACLTWRAARVFRDVDTFYGRLIADDADCWLAHNNLGVIRQERGDFDGAAAHFRAALRVRPSYFHAHFNLGKLCLEAGRGDEATGHFRRALEIKPGHAAAHANIGWALVRQGRHDEAIAEYGSAFRTDPNSPLAHNGMAVILAERGELRAAVRHLRSAVERDPVYVDALSNLGLALWRLGDTSEAERHYRRALRLAPDHALANNNMGLLLADRGRNDDAIRHYRRAIETDPASALAHNNLGLALAAGGDRHEAIASFRAALDIDPDFEMARRNLAEVLAGEDHAAGGVQTGEPVTGGPGPAGD